MTKPTTHRIALVFSIAVAAWLGFGASDAPAGIGSPPAPAAARLTVLGFSVPEARRLLRATETAPAGPGGAYAAQRIAMAILYGNANAFGGPRYHPAD
jgi:hypothetical protein